MKEEDIFNLLMIRGRNIIYYMRIDSRPRSQYIHIVRNWRVDLIKFSRSSASSDRVNLVRDLVKLIPSKVNSGDCYNVMESIRCKYYSEIEFPERVSINQNQEFDE